MSRSARQTVLVLVLALLFAGGWAAPASAAYSSQASPSWVPNGTVKAMARDGAVVYLGGTFTALTNPVTGAQVARSRVAAVDAVTGAPLPWNPGADAAVEALAVGPDGTVYLGGDFTAVGGTSATRLAAVTKAGTRVTAWSASASSTVLDLYAAGSAVFVGGVFGSVNGVSRPKLARLDAATGSLVRTFNARVSGGRVVTLEPSADGRSLLLGGTFTSVGAQPRSFIAGVAPDTGAVTEWIPSSGCDTCYLWDLATTSDTVYGAVGGPGGRVVSWDATTGTRGWSKSGDGNVQAVDVQDGVVYAGGHFGPEFDGATRHQLVALGALRGDLLPWTVAFTGSNYPGIWALDADLHGLRIAGGFSLAGNPARRYAVLPTV